VKIKMKNILFCALLLAISQVAFAGPHGGGHAVRGTGAASHQSTGTGAKAEHQRVPGYTKKDGTRVAPHERSTKDQTKTNNWSTKGNVNPATGKAGSK
jgi:hypothetical protein